MPMTRDQVADFVRGFMAQEMHTGDTTKFKDDIKFSDLGFDGAALYALGKDLNDANWHGVHVTPPEIQACSTIGDLIDLIFGKNPN